MDIDEYIMPGSGVDTAMTDQQTTPVDRGNRTVFSFPTFAALIREFEEMSENSSRGTGRPRGRRPAVRVPCEDCIARASERKDAAGTIELCERCTSLLQRPRKQQLEQPNAKRVRRQSHPTIDTSIGVRTDPIDLPWSDDRQEQHALHFFVEHSAPELAGYFDSPFWQRMLLQAGRTEPAVRYAIAAIGALHEKLLAGNSVPDQTQDMRTHFALEQCNKSIQHLVNPPVAREGRPDFRLMLTTCILFTCFEALQGHCEQAIIHATQGYSLLQQYSTDPENKRWELGAFPVELDQLCLLMRRLQTQSKGLMGKDFNVVPDADAINAQRPTVFNSLYEARAGLELVLNQLTVFFLDMDLDDQFYDLAVSNAEKHLLFHPWLEAWEGAFTSYLSRNQANLTAEDRKAAMVLKAHQLVAEILSDVDLSLGELGWDAFHDKFTAIVELAAAVLGDSKQAETSIVETRWNTTGVVVNPPTATLSFSLGIVDPLYDVCARCRDPALRRRALDLLARHPRQECIWSSWSAWKVGKFLMGKEEEGSESQPSTSSDIPVEQRISEAWLDFSDKSLEQGRGRVGYRKAVARSSAKYGLNQGLSDEANAPEEGFSEDFEMRAFRTDADASPTASTMASESSAALTAAMAEDLATPAWIDYEAIEQMTGLSPYQNFSSRE